MSNTNNQNQSTPTVYAFIDGQNLNMGVKSQRWTLDFSKLRQFLKDNYNVCKAYLFIGYIVGNEPLYTRLQQEGYILIFKPTLEIESEQSDETTVKGNIDAELVLHAMIEYNNYDQAIIASGDGDFHGLIQYLEHRHKLSKIIVPNRNYSSLLKPFEKYILNLSKYRQQLRYSKRK